MRISQNPQQETSSMPVKYRGCMTQFRVYSWTFAAISLCLSLIYNLIS